MAENEERSIKRNFNTAVEKVQDSIDSLLKALFVTGQTWGQLIRKMNIHAEELDKLVNGLTGEKNLENKNNLELYAKGLNRAIANNTSSLRPTPNEAANLAEENIKTALLGHRLTPQSKEKAQQVNTQMDTTLTKLSTPVRQARTAKPVPEAEESEKKESETMQPFKRKPS